MIFQFYSSQTPSVCLTRPTDYWAASWSSIALAALDAIQTQAISGEHGQRVSRLHALAEFMDDGKGYGQGAWAETGNGTIFVGTSSMIHTYTSRPACPLTRIRPEFIQLEMLKR